MSDNDNVAIDNSSDNDVSSSKNIKYIEVTAAL